MSDPLTVEDIKECARMMDEAPVPTANRYAIDLRDGSHYRSDAKGKWTRVEPSEET